MGAGPIINFLPNKTKTLKISRYSNSYFHYGKRKCGKKALRIDPPTVIFKRASERAREKEKKRKRLVQRHDVTWLQKWPDTKHNNVRTSAI
jgi:hypothetical protein